MVDKGRISETPPFKINKNDNYPIKIADLFSGGGGIRLGFQKHKCETVFSCEIDKYAAKTYFANFGEVPHGDITAIDEKLIPDHDILLAGFPCQPFSRVGNELGFKDSRGILFFDIVRVLKEKRPKAFLLENVKSLKTHDKGRTLQIILSELRNLNYYVPEPEVLDAYNFGVPQRRKRIFIVGFNKDFLPECFNKFIFPKGEIDPDIKVGDILEENVPDKYTISDRAYSGHIRRVEKNKERGWGFGFNVFAHDDLKTATLTARYYRDGSEILIKQEGKNPRRLTPRECARLQGFPEEFVICKPEKEAYRQFGNSVCVPVIDALAKSILYFMRENNFL